MENSDKENTSTNLRRDEMAVKIKSENSIKLSGYESDSDIEEKIRSRNSKLSKRVRAKVFKVIESDESEDEDPIYNYASLLDDYESPNLNSMSFDSEEKNYDAPLVLSTDIKKNEEIVVHPKITAQLKSHQVDGLEFLFKSCYNDLNAVKTYRELDQGCILAHCMGLGKTLQLIALLHTVIRYSQLETQKILVICPKSTVLNWKAEIEKWLRPIKGGRKLKVFTFPETS